MAEDKKYGLIKAPDGFYIGRIMKNGMPSKDARKITEQEIIAMFEDVLKRNRAETGRNVMSVFSHGKPVLVAKLNPDIMETGVIERPVAGVRTNPAAGAAGVVARQRTAPPVVVPMKN